MKLLNKLLGLILLGGGGHGRVVLATLAAEGRLKEVLGILDPMAEKIGKELLSVPVLGHEEELVFRFPPSEVALINGVGSTGSTEVRSNLYEKYRQEGYGFTTVLHPSAEVAGDVEWGGGCQIMAGAILQTGCKLADNIIINSGAVVEHDCKIGSHAHISSGVVIAGGVQIGRGSHIGCGATIIQGVDVGVGAVIGAGSVVLRNVPDGAVVVGVPAAVIT
jgi:sugar O-acyltransferase (sialic acid O-acetyltransferase NeuD family)